MSTTTATNGTGIQEAHPRRQMQFVENAGPFENLLDSGKFDHLWRVAKLFSASSLVPEHFRGDAHTADCFIAAQMAIRLGVDPFMMLQNTYVVHGKPGIEAKLAIALINSSGLFSTSLNYQVDGDNPKEDTYRVRAYATRKGEREPIYGPWVDWTMVREEGWLGKAGSKWKTMPGIMFMYRSATLFGRLHCPERLMGMQTKDELDDVGPRKTESRIIGTSQPIDVNQLIAEETTPSETVTQEPQKQAAAVDSDSQDQPPAEEEQLKLTADDFADWPAAEKILLDRGRDMGITRKIMSGAFFKQLGAKPEISTAAQRYELFRAIVEGRVDKASGAIRDAAAQ